jgi:microcystin-dependent protein
VSKARDNVLKLALVAVDGSNLTPAGTVGYFPANTAPTGWLKANGALVSRTTYAALFAVIGTTYGAGDGSTTFALPDLRGEFVRGWDDGRGVDAARGLGTAQADVIKPGTFSALSESANPTGAVTQVSETVGVITIGAAARSRIYRVGDDGATETRPRNVAFLACIKT